MINRSAQETAPLPLRNLDRSSFYSAIRSTNATEEMGREQALRQGLDGELLLSLIPISLPVAPVAPGTKLEAFSDTGAWNMAHAGDATAQSPVALRSEIWAATTRQGQGGLPRPPDRQIF